jgi:hypothetical protein
MAAPRTIGVMKKCWRLRAVIGLLMAGTLLGCQSAGVAPQSVGASGSQTSPESGQSATRTFPDTTSSIVAFSDQFDTSSLTDAQFQFAATNYAGAQKLLPAAAQQLRAYNPNFLVMHYRLGEALGYEVPGANCQPMAGNYLQIINGTWVQEWPGDSVVQAEWFYQYAGQPRVYSCSGGHYLMNLNDASWQSWWSSQVIQQLTTNEDDALFADSYSVPNYFGSTDWSPALPAVDSTFESSWAQSMHAFTDYMSAQFAGRWKWIPNVGSYITSRDPSDYTNTDGVMIEGFADNGNAKFLAPSDWVLQMNRSLALINLDKILIGQTYPSPSSASGAVSERLFVLGSYLLIKGHHTYLNLDAEGFSLQWWPEYQLQLGPPVDPLPTQISTYWNASWNVYVRHYQNGIVLVNPTSNDSGPITLNSTYYQVVGDAGGGVVPASGAAPGLLSYQAVSSPDVCSDCAAILLYGQP